MWRCAASDEVILLRYSSSGNHLILMRQKLVFDSHTLDETRCRNEIVSVSILHECSVVSNSARKRIRSAQSAVRVLESTAGEQFL